VREVLSCVSCAASYKIMPLELRLHRVLNVPIPRKCADCRRKERFVRTGLFKYPGSEEGLQSLTTMDYVNFTEAANFLLLERFPNTTYTLNVGPFTQAQFQNGSNINAFTAPVGGFRDTGVQVFDSFDMGKDWNLSYAAMVGQGSGVQSDNIDGKYDTYLYLSSEKNLASTGPANGLKFFAWNQSGQRLVDVTNDATANRKLYDRKRSGVGVKYMAKPYRVTAEYITANGMIFEGPDKPSYYFAFPANATGANNGADAKARGWYLDGGWYIPNTKWELDARYDILDANIGRGDEHKFSKWTLGTQYLINPMSKITVNYEKRKYDCTASSAQCTNADVNLNGVGNKFSVQVTAAF
ncbi:MAG: porin, partial [Gallionella sp.]